HGASFFDELVEGTGLLRTEIEEALAELVALGLVNSDSFGGLRALLVPSGERRPLASGRRRRRTAKFGMEEAGRWALARRPPPAAGEIRADASGLRTRRARGAHLVAPLRRGVLAAHRTRGCLAAALARSAARLSPAREPRGDPWRAFRRRFLGRAICPSGCGG